MVGAEHTHPDYQDRTVFSLRFIKPPQIPHDESQVAAAQIAPCRSACGQRRRSRSMLLAHWWLPLLSVAIRKADEPPWSQQSSVLTTLGVVVPLVVSIVAAIISAFSAWISTRQLYRAQRSRLGELVDEISRADAEYDRNLLENDFRVNEEIVSNHDLRMEVLARQALELVRSARPRPSSREVIVLANTFGRMNDHETAELLYKQAFAAAAREGPSYLSTIHKEYGLYLFDIGKSENASSQFEEAVKLISSKGGDRSLQRRFQCLGMRAVQHARHGFRIDDADVFLRDAQAALDEVRGEDFREEMRADLRDYQRQIDEAKRRVGKRHSGRDVQ